MDAKWAICRKILGQNRRWKMILPLKNDFGRWIKIWTKYDRWIMILQLEKYPNHWIKPRFNLGRQMHDRWRHWRWVWSRPSDHVKGRDKKLPKKHRNNCHHHKRFFHFIGDLSPFPDISSIHRWYFADILQFFSPPIKLHEISCRRLSIHDISSIYPNIFFHGHNNSNKLTTHHFSYKKQKRTWKKNINNVVFT